MRRCVVDASVAAAALFNEEHTRIARELFLSCGELNAPGLVYPEVASVVWKRRSRNEIDDDEAIQIIADFMSMPLIITPSARLVESALHLALKTRRTVYDCMYLALAIRTKSALITADKRFVNALKNTPLEQHIAHIDTV